MEESIRNLFVIYLKALEDGDMPQEAAKQLAPLMEEDISVRDAIILATICGVDADFMTAFVADPQAYAPKVQALLGKAFRAPVSPIGEDRLGNARATLSLMANVSAEAAQPYATEAYVDWLAGLDDEAVRTAGLALERDPRNTLAAIVLAGIIKAVRFPAHVSH